MAVAATETCAVAAAAATAAANAFACLRVSTAIAVCTTERLRV